MSDYIVVNSISTLNRCCDEVRDIFLKNKYARIKIDSGKRSLSQNALKSVWYKQISDYRRDVTALDVERECKLNYGIPILRRDGANNWLYEKTIDRLPYEKQVIIMSRFAVTSIMSVAELKEYLNAMQSEYPFLETIK